MDALTFLYWALAGGFLLLVVFICVAIFHIIRILRDLADTTASVRDTAEAVNEHVVDLTGKVSSTAEQILKYVVQPMAMLQFFTRKVKPFMDLMQSHSHGKDSMEDSKTDDEADDEEPPKRRSSKRRSSKKRR